MTRPESAEMTIEPSLMSRCISRVSKRCICHFDFVGDVLMTYTGDGLGHATEEGNVDDVDLWLTHLLGVGVEPQVVGAVASQIVLVTTQVQVPHCCFSFSC